MISFGTHADPLEKHDLAAQAPQIVAAMMARLEVLRAARLESPFAGGHQNEEACAAMEKSGMAVVPWQTDDAIAQVDNGVGANSALSPRSPLPIGKGSLVKLVRSSIQDD